VDASRIVDLLGETGPRPACSDAERRAARALAGELRRRGRPTRIETHWVRPQWPPVWLVLALAGLAGSVLSVEVPLAGLVAAAAAAAAAALELWGRLPALSLAWPRRATQNLVSTGPGAAPVRLLITAAYDSPRRRGAFIAPLERLDAALGRLTAGRWPSPLGLLTLSLWAIAGCAAARVAGIEDETWLGAVQLVPTVVCIAATALLSDIALTGPDTSANRDASAPAAALALLAALDRRPPRRLEADLVLAGAGQPGALGMAAHVRRHRREIRPEGVAVLHFEPCGAGVLHAWRRDGRAVPLALHPRLVALAEEAGFALHRGRGVTGALPARRRRWPALAVGRLEASVAPDDLEQRAVDETVERCLDLVRRLDADLARSGVSGG
jgi:hypothetical protein